MGPGRKLPKEPSRWPAIADVMVYIACGQGGQCLASEVCGQFLVIMGGPETRRHERRLLKASKIKSQGH